jgi:hypothetical protein
LSELLQIMVARRGVLIYRTANRLTPFISVRENRVLSFRRDRQGQRIRIGAAVLLRPRICVSLVWRRP